MPNGAVSVTVGYVKEPEQTPRAQYRRRLLQRQTTIFGSIVAIMGILLVVAMLFWTGAIAFPWDREFSAPPDPNQLIVPCLADGTEPVDLATITANVYNSTTRTGIAGEAAAQLGAIGVSVAQTDNWGGTALEETARIRTGIHGVAAAYTLAQYIPGSIVQFDTTMTGETISVVLGTAWSSVSTVEAVAEANPSGTLTSSPDCVDVAPTAGEK